MPRATTSSMTRKRLATSFMTKAEVNSILQFTLDWKCIGVGFLDLAIVFLRVVWNAGATSNIHSRRKHPIQLWKPMQTRPLSKCMLLACAYQRARQRNMGIARNLAKALDNYLAKEGCLEDPFSKQILRNYQPCVSTPKTPEQHKERVNQNNTVYHKCCPRFFILQLMRNIQLTNMTSIVLCFWKTCTGKKCINSYTGLGEG